MSDWLDDAAKGLAEDRLSRRAILGRAAAGLGGALLTGVTPSAALGTIFRPCKFLHCRKGTSCCHGPHGLGCCPKAKCCGGRCCHHNQHCASHAHGVCCSKHDKACSSEGQTTCCPSGTTCCKGVSIPGGRVSCCKHGEVCDSFQGTCCKQKCGPVCCQPGDRCINGVCSGCASGHTPCGPNTCCPPGQKCCTYTVNGKTTEVCYDPSIQQCCSTGGACPQGGPCCSAGCCFPGQFCCPTIDPSNGRNLCGNVSTGFGC
jgi:hypothetical protein